MMFFSHDSLLCIYICSSYAPKPAIAITCIYTKVFPSAGDYQATAIMRADDNAVQQCRTKMPDYNAGRQILVTSRNRYLQ